MIADFHVLFHPNYVLFLPESVWAKGSSNSGGLPLHYIFICSHLHHMFSSSHLHLIFITSSHLHIFTSSHLHIFTSSHLHIFSLSLSPCPLSRSLSFFLFSLLSCGQCRRGAWSGNLFARNEVGVSKTDVNCDFGASAATVSHETRFECKKLMVFCDFGLGPAGTVSHETKFECQKLIVFCEFGRSC